MNKTKKPQPILTLKITTAPAAPAQKAAWQKFWAKLISECKREVEHGK